MMLLCRKCGTDRLVIEGGMMFHNTISQISGAWAPIVEELALSCSAAEPVEFHVHGF